MARLEKQVHEALAQMQQLRSTCQQLEQLASNFGPEEPADSASQLTVLAAWADMTQQQMTATMAVMKQAVTDLGM